MRKKWVCAWRQFPSIDVRNRLTRLETVILAQNHLESGKHSTMDVQTPSRRVDRFKPPIDGQLNHDTSISAKNSRCLVISAQLECDSRISGGILCGKTSDCDHSTTTDHHRWRMPKSEHGLTEHKQSCCYTGRIPEVFAVLVSVLVFKTSEASLAGLVGSIPIHFRSYNLRRF